LPEPEDRFPTALSDALDGVPADARAVWRALGRRGVISELYPGGPDPAPARLGALLEGLDARLPTGVVLSICVQVATVIPLLLESSRRSARAGELAEACTGGEAIVALAVTDAAAAGSDLLSSGTELRQTEWGAALHGGKDWITNACLCDHALVLARHRPARHFTSFRWVVVPVPAEGLTVHPAGGGLFAGAGLGHLGFDGVEVGDAALVGEPGRGLASVARRLGTERLAGALWARALCRRVLAGTHRWLAGRGLDGRTLWDNDAVRQRFARCLVELRRIEALCALHDGGAREQPTEATMVLKAAIAESVDLILGECVQLRGADAFREGGEGTLRAEAAMFGIAGGATGAMLAGIADHASTLLGRAG
jgi:alkylation response protein AidB-like acyl-CoA dehydrogenase